MGTALGSELMVGTRVGETEGEELGARLVVGEIVGAGVGKL